MTAPNTTETPITATPAGAPAAPAAPAASALPALPGAPAAADASKAPDPATVPKGRAATRAAILADAGIAPDGTAPAGDAQTSAVPAKPGEAAKSAGAPAAAAAKPEDGVELKPESGKAPEGVAVKLRFRNAAGEYVASVVPDDHKVELEVNGKKYLKDFAGVARLAVDGIANQQHANENRQIKAVTIPRLESQNTDLRRQLETMVALNREILSDEARYAERRQEYQRLNSPEQRAERAERALVEERASSQQQTTAQRVREYYTANILPALHDVLSEASSVTDEEALGRIALDTRDWMVDGKVPPERYPEFAAYLRGPFAQWAKGSHATREASTAAQRDAETRAADERERQKTAQLATRDVGTAMRPGATTTAPAPGAPSASQQPPRNRAEARRQIMEVAGTAGG